MGVAHKMECKVIEEQQAEGHETVQHKEDRPEECLRGSVPEEFDFTGKRVYVIIQQNS